MDWKLSLAGLLIGLLVGLTGMGGGSLMTPLLVLVFGFKPSIAIGTDIVHGAIFKSFGAAQHRRMGHVHARLTAWMLLGSAPFSLIGVARLVVAQEASTATATRTRRRRSSASRSSSAGSRSSSRRTSTRPPRTSPSSSRTATA